MDASDLILPSGLAARPVTRDDADAVLALVRACEVHDSGAAELDREDLVADWSRPAMDLATMTMAVFDAGTLVAEAEDVARTQGAYVRQIVNDRATAAAELLRSNGYEDSFVSWILAIELDGAMVPAPLPEGIAFRAYRPGTDEREVHRLIEDAFSEWEQREPTSFEDWAATTIGRESFQPWHMVLAADESTDELVGVAFLIDYPGMEEGWIQQLATKSTHRHRGIARALLHRAFDIHRERGKTVVELNTDSRTGALGLYEKVGMRVRSSYTNYVKQLT
jgi:ribosomal protein S18 acetylase RimI-like enzyme